MTVAGCGGAVVNSQQGSYGAKLQKAVNEARQKQGLPALETDALLTRTALARAEQSAAKGVAEPVADRQPDLVKAGAFARFALSHEALGGSLDAAVDRLLADPLCRGKILHPHLTHLGSGFARGKKGVVAVLDLARLAPRADTAAADKAIRERIDEKRQRNSVEPLAVDPKLSQRAGEIAARFMKGEAPREKLIADAQQAIGTENFSLGRVTIAFQVVADSGEVVMPAKTSDPALGVVGIGVAQGNPPDQEPGSLAVVLLLAEPQTAHDARRKISDLPPPKQARGAKAVAQASLVEQAWVSTLSGNHKRAAELFKRAYDAKKDPALLYEAARAFARDDQRDQALAAMKQYAGLVEGKERDKAQAMAAKLEKGETIFEASSKAQMSVEAERFFLIGQRLFEQKEWDGAIDALQQAYAYSKDPDIVYNIGLAHCRAGRIGDALDFFAEYQKLAPGVKDLEQAKKLFNIGTELYLNGQFDAAASHFAIAYGFAPFPELIYNLALCHRAMHENEEAARFLREYINTDPPEKERVEAEKMIGSLAPSAKP